MIVWLLVLVTIRSDCGTRVLACFWELWQATRMMSVAWRCWTVLSLWIKTRLRFEFEAFDDFFWILAFLFEIFLFFVDSMRIKYKIWKIKFFSWKIGGLLRYVEKKVNKNDLKNILNPRNFQTFRGFYFLRGSLWKNLKNYFFFNSKRGKYFVNLY